MTTFDDREQAFEKKFAHDAELQFKVEARARNLLCLWAAHHIGKHSDDAVAYAKGVLQDWMKPGAPDAVTRVMTDLQAAGTTVTDAEVKAKFAELVAQAKQQVMQEH